MDNTEFLRLKAANALTRHNEDVLARLILIEKTQLAILQLLEESLVEEDVDEVKPKSPVKITKK